MSGRDVAVGRWCAAVAAVVVLVGGCGDSGRSSGGGDGAVADTQAAGDAAVADTQPGGDTAAPDDTTAGQDAATDPDGTRYPIAATIGVHDGTFDDDGAAAFDGVRDQPAAASARTAIYENLAEPPLLYKEVDCELRLRRLEVHPPSDGPLLFHATNYPDGGTGTVTLVGRRADGYHWNTIATKAFDTAGPVVFLPEDLENVYRYVAYGVQFSSDEPLAGTIRVAEVALFGYCASPTHVIAWHTTPWLCLDVECVTTLNAGGTERRTVTCARDTGGTAHPDLCDGEAPPSEGESCSLACDHALVYVGPRPFTYSDGSGWLHEGYADRRAGPLPSEVVFGTSVDAIAGKPCSIPTVTPNTYFVGISCTEGTDDADTPLYCAFRCE